PFGLQAGVYTAAVRVSSPRAANSPRTIEVGFTIAPRAQEEFNVWIDGLYLTQVVQNYAGTVPLVAGKPALLRVFVRTNRPNALQPPVRVRLFLDGVEVLTQTIPAPGSSIPE